MRLTLTFSLETVTHGKSARAPLHGRLEFLLDPDWLTCQTCCIPPAPEIKHNYVTCSSSMSLHHSRESNRTASMTTVTLHLQNENPPQILHDVLSSTRRVSPSEQIEARVPAPKPDITIWESKPSSETDDVDNSWATHHNGPLDTSN